MTDNSTDMDHGTVIEQAMPGPDFILTREVDEPTRRMFTRYWATVRPFVRLVLDGMLRTIRDTATGHASINKN